MPDSSLHLVELLGDWPSALLAQQIVRDKPARRLSVAVLDDVAARQAIWFDGLVLDGAYFGAVLR
ncbi:hypothetical protein PH586_22130 [Pseudomonas sp. SA3-5]|uniref:GNAT family N-acetyltransferase n=1 Tax=Pseudomonas aestuarii TaxID=3018340 RepID=A0ABT4XLU6_9PSED|nr:hypothetical protein [Pseudomonas aestuarii]MDA7089083.1 hypothetical protein [Pseudomonas aestuarii]